VHHRSRTEVDWKGQVVWKNSVIQVSRLFLGY
jgi:hypothetical protein